MNGRRRRQSRHRMQQQRLRTHAWRQLESRSEQLSLPCSRRLVVVFVVAASLREGECKSSIFRFFAIRGMTLLFQTRAAGLWFRVLRACASETVRRGPSLDRRSK